MWLLHFRWAFVMHSSVHENRSRHIQLFKNKVKAPEYLNIKKLKTCKTKVVKCSTLTVALPHKNTNNKQKQKHKHLLDTNPASEEQMNAKSPHPFRAPPVGT